MSKEFKAGDWVYYPPYSNKVLTIHERNSSEYPIMVGGQFFTRDGKFVGDESLPSIYHATPKNHALLEQLHGVEFEAPPVKLTSHEIIAAMLERGDKSVHCWVSDTVEEPSSNNTAREIHYIEDGEVTYYVDTDGNAWFFATPFDPRTGDPITELPE